MLGAVSLLFRQIGAVWSHFGINQKISIVLALAATLAAVGGILYTSSRTEYRLLYSGMTLETAAKAREKHDHVASVAGHGRNPHAPGGVKTHVVTKAFAGIAIGAGIDIRPAQGQPGRLGPGAGLAPKVRRAQNI